MPFNQWSDLDLNPDLGTFPKSSGFGFGLDLYVFNHFAFNITEVFSGLGQISTRFNNLFFKCMKKRLNRSHLSRC